MTKTEALLNKITKRIESLKIAGYIKEEAITSLKYLHRYKLKNIDKNLSSFCEYLFFLNKQNTDKIDKLGEIHKEKKLSEKKDLSYFLVSDRKLSKQKESSYLKKISGNGYELLTLIQGMKGILVLSIDEFCNASKTRMDIHQLLIEEDLLNNQ